MKLDLLIKNASCISHNGVEVADIAIREGMIVAIGHLGDFPTENIIEARGLHLLPGVIDAQVDFSQGADSFEQGSKSAVIGGVTSVIEFSSTSDFSKIVEIGTKEFLQKKGIDASSKSWCDFGFYAPSGLEGQDFKNIEKIEGCAAVKIFMGTPTDVHFPSALNIWDEETVTHILKNTQHRVVISGAIASPDEEVKNKGHLAKYVQADLLEQTSKIIDIARKLNRTIHFQNISTADEMALVAAYKDVVTVEVTPQHLSFSAPEIYEKFGSKMNMNPPIREEKHRVGLWKSMVAGIIDTVSSQHLAHRVQDKEKGAESPSGMAAVQTLLPLMLDHVNRGSLSLERLMDLTSAGPARIFNIVKKGRLAVGYDADFSLIDLKKKWIMDEKWFCDNGVASPLLGEQMTGKPVGTIIRGQHVMQDGKIIGKKAGLPLKFIR